MDREALGRDIDKLAGLLGGQTPDTDEAAAIGLAVGLAGVAVIALASIAESLERIAGGVGETASGNRFFRT